MKYRVMKIVKTKFIHMIHSFFFTDIICINILATFLLNDFADLVSFSSNSIEFHNSLIEFYVCLSCKQSYGHCRHNLNVISCPIYNSTDPLNLSFIIDNIYYIIFLFFLETLCRENRGNNVHCIM